MIAIEVSINGVVKGVCGADNLDQLMTWVNISTENKEPGSINDSATIELHCNGFRSPSSDEREALKWFGLLLHESDEVTFRFIRTDVVSEPIDRNISKKLTRADREAILNRQNDDA